jgi:hypothetical protein
MQMQMPCHAKAKSFEEEIILQGSLDMLLHVGTWPHGVLLEEYSCRVRTRPSISTVTISNAYCVTQYSRRQDDEGVKET